MKRDNDRQDVYKRQVEKRIGELIRMDRYLNPKEKERYPPVSYTHQMCIRDSNQTVTTANGGKFQIDNLMPGIYTVTEQAYDKYEPQETHRVTVVAGQVAKVTFNNKLKRGDLQVVKLSLIHI